MHIIGGSWISGTNGLQISSIKNVNKFSTSVDVSWSWFNKREGTVSWNFVNNSYLQSTVILFRNGYYFGNAYFPIYVENGLTKWATTIQPLVDNGVEKNSMPVAVLNFGSGDRIVAFIFTLSGGQKWSVLEGGFSEIMPPENVAIYDVSFERSGNFCIGYDPRQIADWDRQTKTGLKGYSPNPMDIQTVELSIPTVAPFVKLFKGDSISDNRCPGDNDSKSENYKRDDLEEIIGNIIRRIRSI